MLIRPTLYTRVIFFILADWILGFLTLYLSYSLRFNFAVPPAFLEKFGYVAVVLVVLKMILFFVFKIYYKSWRFFGLKDLQQLIVAHTIAYIIFGVIFLLFDDWFNPMPRSAVIMDFFLSLMFLSMLRILKRVVTEKGEHSYSGKAVIVGVDSTTPSIIKNALSGDIPYYPECVVSQKEDIVGSYIENIKVYPQQNLEELCQNQEIDTAIICGEYEPKELDTLIERLNSCGVCRVKRVSLISDKDDRLKDIDIEDLLARKPKDLDIEVIESFISDKTVLVTGAGGSIGSEICKQVLEFGAKRLILVENSEFNLYRLCENLNSSKIVPKLISITDKEALAEVMDEYRPDIVVHAAAYKHVPLCEANIKSAVYNNIAGVMNVIDLSIEYGVKKVVNISSDKAVRPTNVMGATKRVGELYCQNIQSKDTEIVSVRFGNVLGSSGSVVPKFKAQIEAGGPVTVTHPDITRYFMLIPEACRLVLQAAAMAKGGELFILDMGEPVKIVDLAKKMIRLYGKESEIEIVFTGLRAGEKLYEELLIDEAECKTKYDSIFVAKATEYHIDELKEDIKGLFCAKDPKEYLKKIVPEYKPANSEGNNNA